ncbi:MAG: hypothetical protein ACJASR_001923, partial [Psychroserpens sp.]
LPYLTLLNGKPVSLDLLLPELLQLNNSSDVKTTNVILNIFFIS